MKKTTKRSFPLGEYLKELREKKGVSLMDVEKAIKIPNAYISQLETGARRKLPEADRLRAIADYYNVKVEEILAKAGYYEQKNVIKETYEDGINKAFLHVIYDPQFKTGHRIDPNNLPMDVKRFVVEMHAYNVKRSSFSIKPQAAGTIVENDIVRSLRWKTEDVSRDSYKSGGRTMIRYRVRVTCTETEGAQDEEKIYFEGPKQGTEKITQTVTGEGVYEEFETNWQGYEAILLIKATENAIRNALPKIKGTNWASIIKPSVE